MYKKKIICFLTILISFLSGALSLILGLLKFYNIIHIGIDMVTLPLFVGLNIISVVLFIHNLYYYKNTD